MKRKALKIMAGTVLGAALFSAGAFASSHLEAIKANLDHALKIRVDGKVAEMTDVNGNTVLPIKYKGSTYVPIRAVANLTGVAVDYDEEAYEVILGEKLEGIAIKYEEFGDTLYSKDPSHTTIGGKDYGEVLYSEQNSNFNSFMLYPQGNYQTLALQIAILGEEDAEVVLRDLDSNAVLRTVPATGGTDGLVTIEADIAGVKTVVVEIKKEDNASGGFIVPLTTSYYK